VRFDTQSLSLSKRHRTDALLVEPPDSSLFDRLKDRVSAIVSNVWKLFVE
jgi:hypothetical protein